MILHADDANFPDNNNNFIFYRDYVEFGRGTPTMRGKKKPNNDAALLAVRA